MGFIFTNIFPCLPCISSEVLNPKFLDLTALPDWVRLQMRILQSKLDTSHQFAFQFLFLSKATKSPSNNHVPGKEIKNFGWEDTK